MTVKEVIDTLNYLANPEVIIQKQKKFGIKTDTSLGIRHSDLSEIAKQIKREFKKEERDNFSLELFDTGIYEAKILLTKVYNPKSVTEKQMEKWIKHFDNWEICDSFCMGLFSKSNFAVEKIIEWSSREKKFEKRASFATLASYCMTDKQAENKVYEQFLPIIIRESTDERLYVKKAVNWALRSIGKRNKDLREIAIETAEKILEQDSRAAKWIARDAIRELNLPNLSVLDYPRDIYRR